MDISLNIGGRSVDEVVANAQAAVDGGFQRAWLANIFGVDAITAIAVAGRAVPGITIGTAVVPTFPRHPHALAQQAITAWDATGGRFVLGIGLSHQIVIESMFGLSFDRPAVHMREYLAVLLPLLREGNADFSGEVYNVHAPLERAGDPAGPPVLIAAMAPVMLRLAGEQTDGTILWMAGARAVAEHVAPRITKAAADAGRRCAADRRHPPRGRHRRPGRRPGHGGVGVQGLRRLAVLPRDARQGGCGRPGRRGHRRRRGHGHCGDPLDG